MTERWCLLSDGSRRISLRRSGRGIEVRFVDTQAELAAHRLSGSKDRFWELMSVLDQAMHQNPHFRLPERLNWFEIARRQRKQESLAETLTMMVLGERTGIRRVLERPGLPAFALRWMFERQPHLVARYPELPEDLRARLRQSPDRALRLEFAFNPVLWEADAAVLLKDRDHAIRLLVLQRQDCPAELAKEAIRSLWAPERELIAGRARPEVAALLASDPDPKVRALLALRLDELPQAAQTELREMGSLEVGL